MPPLQLKLSNAMVSADTNVVVRLLTGDDAAQTASARALLAAQRIWIGNTVILETEWVLRTGYGFGSDAIHEAFVRLMGHPHVEIEDDAGVLSALALTLKGVDFADALHLFGRPAGTEFVTFDRTFVRRAQRAGVQGISEIYLSR